MIEALNTWCVNNAGIVALLGALGSFVAAVFTAVYGYYTVKTFREIHLQTELQVEAILVVEAFVVEVDSTATQPRAANLVVHHDEWSRLAQRAAPDLPQNYKLIKLRLTNRGRSDVSSWQILGRLSVEPGAFLSGQYKSRAETYDWKIESAGARDMVVAGSFIEVLALPTGMFPIARATWTVSYRDARGRQYQSAFGDSEVRDSNALLSKLHAPGPGSQVA